MRCAACGADNPAGAKKCASCGERVNRRPRRHEVPDESDSPFAPVGDPRRRTAQNAYRCGVFSLIPPAGLVLGPAAVLLALLAWLRARRDPTMPRNGHITAALLLGVVTFVAHAAGLLLILRGLTEPGE